MRTPAVFDTWSRNPGASSVYTPFASSSLQLSRQQVGYVGARTPGDPVGHSYSLGIVETRLNNVYDHTKTDGGQVWGSGPCLAPSTTILMDFSPSWSSLDSILYNRALDQLNDKVRGNLDLSVDLAEAGKTAKMLSVTNQVVEFSKTYAKRFGVLKVASSAWLGYTYGVKPLLGTIYGLAEENLRVVINKSAKFSGRASMRFEPKSVILNTIWGAVSYPIASSSIKRSCTVGVDVRTDQFDISRFSSLNPASIAWELLPLSFVADWFYNVGGYLRNMETYVVNANKFRGGYITRLTTGDFRIDSTSRERQSGYVSNYSRTTGYGRVVNILRSTLDSYPFPEPPSLGANLGSSRLLSAASLLATLGLGRR